MKCLRFRASLLILASGLAPAALGEHALSRLVRPLPAITGGRRLDAKAHRYVVALEIGGGTCTGTMIGGCALTAGHCFDPKKKARVSVHFGSSVAEPTRHTLASRYSVVSDEAHEDIAVVRLDLPPPAEFTLGVDVLASEEDIPRSGDAEIVGFGYSNTVEPKLGKVENIGIGEKRVGISRVEGIGYVDDKELKFMAREKSAKRTFVVSRGPSVMAPGDSGGPLLVQGRRGMKLVGIASRVHGRQLSLSTDEKKNRKHHADEVAFASYTLVPDRRAQILALLRRYDCAGHTQEAVRMRITAAMKSLLSAPASRKPTGWLSAVEESRKNALLGDIRLFLGLTEETMDLDRSTRDERTAELTFTVTTFGVKRVQTLRYDLRTGALSRVKGDVKG